MRIADDVVETAGILIQVDNRGDINVDGDGLAGGGADIAGGVNNPRRVGEVRRVRVGGVVVAPGRRGELGNIVPAGAAVAADLNLLARSQRAVGARHDQRGVAGDEVVIGAAKRGVGDNRGDRQRLRRRTRVDGDGLAGGGADIAGGVN